MSVSLDTKQIAGVVTLRRAFGRAVKRARVDLEMTTHDLAVEAETTQRTVEEIESGLCFATGVMRRVADVLGIESEEIEAERNL